MGRVPSTNTQKRPWSLLRAREQPCMQTVQLQSLPCEFRCKAHMLQAKPWRQSHASTDGGAQQAKLQGGQRKFVPAKTALGPNSSSIRSSWLYFDKRSLRHGAPVLICPVRRPTTRSAMKESSVSPER